MQDEPKKNGAGTPSATAQTAKRDIVFDYIALEVFDLRNVDPQSSEGGRIGMVTAALRKRLNILKTSPDELQEKAKENLSAFLIWYDKETEGAARPRDRGKFMEWYVKWEQSVSPQTAAAPIAYNAENFSWDWFTFDPREVRPGERLFSVFLYRDTLICDIDLRGQQAIDWLEQHAPADWEDIATAFWDKHDFRTIDGIMSMTLAERRAWEKKLAAQAALETTAVDHEQV